MSPHINTIIQHHITFFNPFSKKMTEKDGNTISCLIIQSYYKIYSRILQYPFNIFVIIDCIFIVFMVTGHTWPTCGL